MAHPYASKMQGGARAKAMFKAQGGPVDAGGPYESGTEDGRQANVDAKGQDLMSAMDRESRAKGRKQGDYPVNKAGEQVGPSPANLRTKKYEDKNRSGEPSSWLGRRG